MYIKTFHQTQILDIAWDGKIVLKIADQSHKYLLQDQNVK